MSGAGARWATGIVVLLLLGMASVQRIHVTNALVADSSDGLFLDGHVLDGQLLGVDAWFHVRMAQYTAHHFPHHLREDGAAFFPDVRRQEVSGIMNVLHAAVIRIDLLFTGNRDRGDGTGEQSSSVRQSAFRTGPWLPVALGLGVFLVVFVLGRQLGGRGVALGSMALLLLFPGTFLARSALGFLDQHVLEALLAVAIPAGMIAALRSGGRWPVVVATAQLPVIFLFSWLGASVYFMHMTVMAAIVLLSMTEDVRRASFTVSTWFLSAAVGYGLVSVLLPDWPLEMQPGIRWLFPLAFLGLAFCAAVYGWVVQKGGHNGRPGGTRSDGRHWRAGTAVLFVVGASVAVWLIEPLRELLVRAFERQPMDIVEVDVTVTSIFRLFGAVVPLAVVGWLGHVLRGTPVERGVAGWAFLVGILWLSSGDFDYVPPAFVAIYGTIGMRDLLRQLRRSATSTQTKEMWAGVIILTLLLILPIQPFGWVRSPLSISESREAIPRYSAAWHDAMDWMRTNTPQPTPTRTTRSDYGVMTGWLYGNAVLELGHRSPTFARYPSVLEPAWFLSTTRQEERRLRCPKCAPGQRVAYAVLDAEMAAGGYAFLRMNAEKRNHIDEIPVPVFDASYEQALVTRLITKPGSVPDISVVYQSPERQVLYWDTNPRTGARWRRLAPLGSPVNGDTVHTVQIFALHE